MNKKKRIWHLASGSGRYTWRFCCMIRCFLNRAGDYTYPQFLQDIQERADAIEEVIIVPNVEVPTGKVEVLWNDDSQSECYVTDVNEVQSLLKQTSVDRWFVTDAQRDSWLEKMVFCLVSESLRWYFSFFPLFPVSRAVRIPK